MPELLKQRSAILSTKGVRQALNSQDVQIIEASINLRFADLAPKDQEKELREAIAKTLVMLGIKNVPENVMINIILTFMRNHFRLLTMQEFVVAFELNILSDSPIGHFQNFGIEFIGPVIKNYLLRKTEALNALAKLSQPKELPAPLQTNEQAFNFIQDHFTKHKEFPFACNWGAAYDHMEDNDLVTETDVELREFKSTIKEKVHAKVSFDLLHAGDLVERNKIKERLKHENLIPVYKMEYVKHYLTVTQEL